MLTTSVITAVVALNQIPESDVTFFYATAGSFRL